MHFQNFTVKIVSTNYRFMYYI